MKLTLFIFTFSVYLCDFAFGKINVRNGLVVGVSNRKLENYMAKAIRGFRKVVLEGDQELDYPIMDPYKLEDVSWDYIDPSPVKKYKLNLFNKNTAVIKGLSNYTVEKMIVNAKDLSLFLKLNFHNLEAKIPYKLEGFLFKGLLPTYGEGLITLTAKTLNVDVAIDLELEQSYIVVENALLLRAPQDYDIEVTGLMDLPPPFASSTMDNILDTLMLRHGQEMQDRFLRNLVEETIGGMTTDELFDYLDHFVKKDKN